MKKRLSELALFWLCTLALACGGQPSEQVSDNAPPAVTETTTREETPGTLKPGTPKTDSLQPDPSRPATVSREVPARLIDQLRNQVAADSGLDKSSIVTVRAAAVTWRDGSLGCPQPGMMYTQALVDGYWVVLRAGREEFDFRSGLKGRFNRCIGGNRQAPITENPES